MALADRVRQLKASGTPVISLQTGDPDFPTPPGVIEVAYRSLKEGITHYTDSRGLPELRRAIAKSLHTKWGVQYDPDHEILVTNGGIHAYYCSLLAILNPNDEVLLVDPAWMPHVNIVRMLGARVVRVPANAENDFWPALEDWSRALSPKTVALVVNSPNNPTGAVATRDYLIALNDFAKAHGLYVISDEVYDNILYDGHAHTCFSSLPDAKDHTILVNSFSKTYAMTGWRVGYLAGNAEVISNALKASQHSITNVAPFIQKAAAFALNDPQTQQFVQNMMRVFSRRRAMTIQLWQTHSGTPIRLYPPQGAFYFFLDVRTLGVPSALIAQNLLNDVLVALAPGSFYGPAGEGFLRMTIAAADQEIQNGFQSVLEWVDKNFHS